MFMYAHLKEFILILLCNNAITIKAIGQANQYCTLHHVSLNTFVWLS